MGTEPLNIICTTDVNYFDHFVALARSIVSNVTNYKLHARLVHVEQHHIDKILSVSPDIRIIDDKTDASDKRTIVRTGIDLVSVMDLTLRERLISERLLHCVYSKYDNAKLLFDEGCNEILVMDADGVVRKDLTELHELIRQHEFIAREETRKPIGLFPLKMRLISEGVMGFRNTPLTRSFIDRIIAHIDSVKGTPEHNFQNDTFAIAKLMDELTEIDYLDLPVMYKDWQFDPESYIWSGQGKGKHSDIYLTEKAKYED